MNQVSVVRRRRHLSRRTEEAHRFWIRRYIHFHNRQHPRAIGPDGIVGFVNHLATVWRVAASTQSQALNALLFLYRDVLEVEVGVRAEKGGKDRSTILPAAYYTPYNASYCVWPAYMGWT